jgi:hypothetical protein
VTYTIRDFPKTAALLAAFGSSARYGAESACRPNQVMTPATPVTAHARGYLQGRWGMILGWVPRGFALDGRAGEGGVVGRVGW